MQRNKTKQSNNDVDEEEWHQNTICTEKSQQKHTQTQRRDELKTHLASSHFSLEEQHTTESVDI